MMHCPEDGSELRKSAIEYNYWPEMSETLSVIINDAYPPRLYYIATLFSLQSSNRCNMSTIGFRHVLAKKVCRWKFQLVLEYMNDLTCP